MVRTLIYGNSGSGKSRLALSIANYSGVPHLDLDEIAWESSGQRKHVSESIRELASFISANTEWVIEGCYSSLVKEASASAEELIFLNPGVDVCQENCKSRPWEPHKYDTKESQDKNLEMLLEWVEAYETRTDEFSLQAHQEIFESFPGRKSELRSNLEAQNKAEEVAANRRPSSEP